MKKIATEIFISNYFPAFGLFALIGIKYNLFFNQNKD